MQSGSGVVVLVLYVRPVQVMCVQDVCFCALFHGWCFHKEIHHFYPQKILPHSKQWYPNITTFETKSSTLNINNPA